MNNRDPVVTDRGYRRKMRWVGWSSLLGARGIGVRADDDEAVAGGIFGSHGESGHRGHVTREEVLAPGLEAPRISLRYLLHVRVAFMGYYFYFFQQRDGRASFVCRG